MTINIHLSIIILNVNGLNTPIIRHGKAEWIRKQETYTIYIHAICKRPTSDIKT